MSSLASLSCAQFAGAKPRSIADLLKGIFSGGLGAQVKAILAKYGTNAHLYLPHIGVLNGLTAGNYLDSAGTTAGTVDNPVGLVLDAARTRVDYDPYTMPFSSYDGLGASTIVRNLNTLTFTNAAFNDGYRFSAISSADVYSVVEFVASGTGRLLVFAGGSPTTVTLTGTPTAYKVVTHPNTSGFTIFRSDLAGTTAIITINAVYGIRGVHASQPTTANKPVLRKKGSNVLSNGGFNSDTVWTKGLGVAITGGVAQFTNVSANLDSLYVLNTVPTNYWYEVTYTIKNYVSGSVRYSFGGQSGVVRSANGTYTDRMLNSAGNASFIFKASSEGTTLQIDDVSIAYVDSLTSTDTNYFWQFDATDYLESSSVTLGAAMDCFMAVKLDTSAMYIGVTPSTTGTVAFMVANPADGAGLATTGMTGGVYKVNGIELAGGAAVKRNTLSTALGAGEWKVVETYDLNMTVGWPKVMIHGYTGFMAAHSVGIVIIIPAMTSEERTIVRKFCAQLSGVTL